MPAFILPDDPEQLDPGYPGSIRQAASGIEEFLALPTDRYCPAVNTGGCNRRRGTVIMRFALGLIFLASLDIAVAQSTAPNTIIEPRSGASFPVWLIPPGG